MAILTTAEAKEYLHEITASSTAQDDRINDIVSAADSLLARALGYPETDSDTHTLESATYTEYLNGPSETNHRAILLRATPVTAITSIHVSSDWAYDAGDLVDSGDYVIERSGWVYLTPSASSSFESGLRVIKVVYTGGAALDDGEKEAAGQLVAHLFRISRRQGRQSSSQKGHSASFRVEDIPGHILAQFSHRAARGVIFSG